MSKFSDGFLKAALTKVQDREGLCELVDRAILVHPKLAAELLPLKSAAVDLPTRVTTPTSQLRTMGRFAGSLLSTRRAVNAGRPNAAGSSPVKTAAGPMQLSPAEAQQLQELAKPDNPQRQLLDKYSSGVYPAASSASPPAWQNHAANAASTLASLHPALGGLGALAQAGNHEHLLNPGKWGEMASNGLQQAKESLGQAHVNHGINTHPGLSEPMRESLRQLPPQERMQFVQQHASGGVSDTLPMLRMLGVHNLPAAAAAKEHWDKGNYWQALQHGWGSLGPDAQRALMGLGVGLGGTALGTLTDNHWLTGAGLLAGGAMAYPALHNAWQQSGSQPGAGESRPTPSGQPLPAQAAQPKAEGTEFAGMPQNSQEESQRPNTAAGQLQSARQEATTNLQKAQQMLG